MGHARSRSSTRQILHPRRPALVSWAPPGYPFTSAQSIGNLSRSQGDVPPARCSRHSPANGRSEVQSQTPPLSSPYFPPPRLTRRRIYRLLTRAVTAARKRASGLHAPLGAASDILVVRCAVGSRVVSTLCLPILAILHLPVFPPGSSQCNLPRTTPSLSKTDPNATRAILPELGRPSALSNTVVIGPSNIANYPRISSPGAPGCGRSPPVPHPCFRNLRNWCGRSPKDRPSRLPDAPPIPGRFSAGECHSQVHRDGSRSARRP
jgi:hypothetical protein